MEELADELQLIAAAFDVLQELLTQDETDIATESFELGEAIYLSADAFEIYAVAKEDLGRHIRKLEKVVLKIEGLLLDMRIGEQVATTAYVQDVLRPLGRLLGSPHLPRSELLTTLRIALDQAQLRVEA